VKVFTFLVMAGILAVHTISSAQAQVASPVATIIDPITVRVGVVWPNAASTRYWAGSSPFSMGVDYALAQSGLSDTNVSSAFADYYGGDTNGGHVNVFGIGLSNKVYLNSGSSGNPMTGQAVYAGGGTGAYRFEDSNGNGTTIGAKAFVGVEFSKRYVVQLNYLFLPQETGLNASGFGLQVGMRM